MTTTTKIYKSYKAGIADVTVTTTDLDSGSVDFGFVDQKGRACGYKWSIQQIVSSEPTTHCERLRSGEDYVTIVDYAAGEPFVRLESTPTRNGNGYGPAFNYVNLSTLEAARRLAVKRAEASRKRDAKKFTKPEAA